MTQLQEYALIENGEIARTEWFKRPSLVPAMAGALGLTDEQIDNLFIEGVKIR